MCYLKSRWVDFADAQLFHFFVRLLKFLLLLFVLLVHFNQS
jgi:hypothetical protein